MSIRLTRIVLRELPLALREPFQISSGVTTTRRILLLEREDSDGATVWSECGAGERPNFSAETIDTAWLAITEWIAPRVLGKSVSHPSTLDAILGRDTVQVPAECGLRVIELTEAAWESARTGAPTRVQGA